MFYRDLGEEYMLSLQYASNLVNLYTTKLKLINNNSYAKSKIQRS